MYEGKNLEGAEGRSLVAALLSVYGPRTTVWAAGSGAPGAWEFTLRAGTWTLSGFCGSMDAPVRVFAPANLRAAHGNPKLEAALAHYRRERYTLRYSGALVPDVAMMLTRRGGIYFSPVAEGAPAKLRLLFELQPVAYVVEAAGGAAVTDEGRFVMEMPVEASDQRAGGCSRFDGGG